MMELHKKHNTIKYSNSTNKILSGFLKNFNSINTRIAYEKDLMSFFVFIKKFEGKINLNSIDHHLIVEYRNFLESRAKGGKEGLSEASVNRKIASISRFFTHLIREGLIKDNPCLYVKRHKVELAVKTKFIPEDKVKKMINLEVGDDITSLLHKAVIVTLFTTGMRQGELRNLRRKCFQKRDEGYTLVYKAKGEKNAIKYLHPKCSDAINAYLKACEDFSYNYKGESYVYRMSEADYLFRPTRLGNNKLKNLNRGLSSNSVRMIVEKYCKLVGIEPVSPHSARASLATMLNNSGQSLVDIQHYLGHSSVNMSAAYVERSSNKDILQNLNF